MQQNEAKNIPPLHVSLNISATRPSFKNLHEILREGGSGFASFCSIPMKKPQGNSFPYHLKYGNLVVNYEGFRILSTLSSGRQ